MKREVVHCSGAPRDLGLDQGRAFASQIREEATKPPSAAKVPHLRRDTLRDFPHSAERMIGLAKGACVKEEALFGLLARAFHASADASMGCRTAGGAVLLRGMHPGKPIFVRHSMPDACGFGSVEIALPWRIPALAGVNECGLAISTVAALSEGSAPHAAPAVLLTQDVLQRFDGVEKALEWLASRPAGGAADFVLADAEGTFAGFSLRPGERTRMDLVEGRVKSGNPELQRALDASLVHGEDVDIELWAQAWRKPGVLLDPAARRLVLVDTEGVVSWHEAEAIVAGD